MIKELKSELSGHFEDAVLGLLMPPEEFDAYQMHIAMKVIKKVMRVNDNNFADRTQKYSERLLYKPLHSFVVNNIFIENICFD